MEPEVDYDFFTMDTGVRILITLVMLVTGSIEVWHIYVVQIVVGLITPLYTPASQAITPSIVSQGQLQDANAYIDGMTRLMMFLAPVLGGVVIHFIGTELTLSFVCICLFVSGAFLLYIKEKRTTTDIRKTWLEQFLQGFTYFLQNQSSFGSVYFLLSCSLE